MASKGSAITVVAAVLLFSLVLSPPPVAEAARRTAQEYNIPRPPRGPVFCPACVCCTPKPRFGCCSCCAVPIDPATELKSP